MPKVSVWASFLLVAALAICSGASAQESPAGQRPALGNQPAANPGQQGTRRGPAPPVQGPAHDPHDLTGIWNARRGYGARL